MTALPPSDKQLTEWAKSWLSSRHPIAGLQRLGRSVRIMFSPRELASCEAFGPRAMAGHPLYEPGTESSVEGHESRGYPGAEPDLGITCGFGFAVR